MEPLSNDEQLSTAIVGQRRVARSMADASTQFDLRRLGGRLIQGALAKFRSAGLDSWTSVSLVLLRTGELFWMQAATLRERQIPLPVVLDWYASLNRLMLDVSATGALVCLLPKWILVGVLATQSLAHLLLLTYFAYFHRPLSIFTILSQTGDAFTARTMLVSLVPWGAAFAIACILIVKWTTLWRWRRPSSTLFARIPAVAICLGIATTFLAESFLLFPISHRTIPYDIAMFGRSRGYLAGWLMEWQHQGETELLESALADARRIHDRLTPHESDVSITGRLVIIQVESLGYDIIGYRANGREVTPFLNRLRDLSMYYRVLSLRRHGSADADFVMLSGKMRAESVLNYALPRFSYRDALPFQLQEMGYQSIAIMCAPGRVFCARPAYEQMGFKKLLFLEELQAQYGGRVNVQGLHDGDLYSIAALEIRSSPAKCCVFITNGTSHSPFNMLRDDEKLLFPSGKAHHEDYFNSFHYTDQCLAKLVSSLPNGTTVVIYGDHSAGVNWEDYHADRDEHGDYVPYFIYQVGSNLAVQQKTRDQPIASDGSIDQLDLATYLRHQLRRSHGLEPGDLSIKDSPASL